MNKIFTTMKTLTLLICFFGIVLATFAQENNEELYKAVIDNDKDFIENLIKEGADVNYVKEVGPWMKVNALITAVNNEYIEIAKLLLDNNADVNWKDGFNTSAIIYAAATGNQEMVELLLGNGADINDNDGQGNTVLTAAKESKNKDLIKIIKEKIKEKE